MNLDEYREELRSQLLRAQREQRHLTARRSERSGHALWLPVAAAILVLVIAGSLVVMSGSPASASVEVLVRDGFITIRLTDAQSRASEIEKIAAEHGLNIEVVTEPVGPSNVGRFIRSSSTPLPDGGTVEGSDGQSFNGFRLPVDWPGELTLSYGREADAGESWGAVSNALAPGEAAACLDVLGKPLDAVVERLRDRSLNVRVFVMDPGDTEVQADATGPYGEWPVAMVQSAGVDQVFVRATRDGASPVPGQDPSPRGC